MVEFDKTDLYRYVLPGGCLLAVLFFVFPDLVLVMPADSVIAGLVILLSAFLIGVILSLVTALLTRLGIYSDLNAARNRAIMSAKNTCCHRRERDSLYSSRISELDLTALYDSYVNRNRDDKEVSRLFFLSSMVCFYRAINVVLTISLLASLGRLVFPYQGMYTRLAISILIFSGLLLPFSISQGKRVAAQSSAYCEMLVLSDYNDFVDYIDSIARSTCERLEEQLKGQEDAARNTN